MMGRNEKSWYDGIQGGLFLLGLAGWLWLWRRLEMKG